MKAFKLIFLLFSSIFAEVSLEVRVDNFRNSDGYAHLVIFNSENGFPSTYSLGFRDTTVSSPDSLMVFSFNNLPEGVYAVSVLHDENGNNDMDYGLFGMPLEGYGVSENIYPRFRPPRFSECSFFLRSGESKVLNISLKYP